MLLNDLLYYNTKDYYIISTACATCRLSGSYLISSVLYITKLVLLLNRNKERRRVVASVDIAFIDINLNTCKKLSFNKKTIWKT